MKRIVVTGGCGLLGEYVVGEFSKSYQVTVLDVREPSRESRKGTELSNCCYHRCDVLDRENVVKLLQDHDGVVHLAGIDVAIDAPDAAYFETNVMGTWNVLHAAELAGHSKAVICSSVSAVGFSDDDVKFGPDRLPADESQRLRPTHPYGLSKQVMEVVGKSFAARGNLDVVALRPSLVVFPHILDEVIRLTGLADGEGKDNPLSDEVPKGSLSPVRSYVRPDDAARCFRQALEADTGAYDEFFVLASDTYSPEPTLDALIRRFGRLPQIDDPSRYTENPRAAALSNLKAQRILGWRPSSDWPAFVAEMRA